MAATGSLVSGISMFKNVFWPMLICEVNITDIILEEICWISITDRLRCIPIVMLNFFCYILKHDYWVAIKGFGVGVVARSKQSFEHS